MENLISAVSKLKINRGLENIYSKLLQSCVRTVRSSVRQQKR